VRILQLQFQSLYSSLQDSLYVECFLQVSTDMQASRLKLHRCDNFGFVIRFRRCQRSYLHSTCFSCSSDTAYWIFADAHNFCMLCKMDNLPLRPNLHCGRRFLHFRLILPLSLDSAMALSVVQHLEPSWLIGMYCHFVCQSPLLSILC
jgi:hypothetical protein